MTLETRMAIPMIQEMESDMPRSVLPLMMIGVLCASPAFAANDQSQNSQSGQQSSVDSANQQQSLLTVQKLKQDLQNAGFTDINVLREAFVVRAKTKSGDPVVMTIGPGGFEMVEAVRARNTAVTGSTSSTSGSSNSQPNTSR